MCYFKTINGLHRLLFSFLFILLLLLPVISAGSGKELTKEQKVVASNIAGISVITAWGIVNWDYFDTGVNSQSEGWFSEDTRSGGADKLGHFYTSYSLSHLLGTTYENWGYSQKKSAMLGSVSSFTLMGWMEAGDSFSTFGFAGEDFLMNTVGCITGYYMAVSPELSEKIDLRIEYLPEFDTADVFTDYDHIKYFLALKLDGFDSVKNEVLKFLEFNLGYYTRDYSGGTDKKRNLFVGIGLNMSEIFNQCGMKKTSKLAEYVQVPFTYAGRDEDLNE